MSPRIRQPLPPDRLTEDDLNAGSAQSAAKNICHGSDLLSAQQSASRLGISVSSLYDWLSQSDRGEFVIRGESVTIDYFQTGRCGQGRIRLAVDEVERLKELFRVRPRKTVPRRQPVKPLAFPGITVALGRPK
jgi:hypothetical protein